MSILKLNKIGSDPEFFISSEDQRLIPSFFFFEGTKINPQIMDNGFAVLKDNLLVEGNIPPADSREEFVSSMKFLKSIISVPLKQKNCKISYLDIGEFEEGFIYSPDGQEFGCGAFFNAYTRDLQQTPRLNSNTRQAGFHIHASYDLENKDYNLYELNFLIAKAFDFFLGIPSDEISYSKERRNSYGILGGFRSPEYGIEYRALGGLFTQDKYLDWVYNQTVKVFDYCNNIDNLQKLEQVKQPSKEYYQFLDIELDKQLYKEKLVLIK